MTPTGVLLQHIIPHSRTPQADSRFGVPRPSEDETNAEDAIYSRIRGGDNSRSSLNLLSDESGAETDNTETKRKLQREMGGWSGFVQLQFRARKRQHGGARPFVLGTSR